MPVVDIDDELVDIDPLVSLDELKKRYDVQDDAAAEVVLEDISALVRDAAGNENIWADVTTAPRAIKVIVIRAAIRSLNNPDGFQSESYGSYSYSYGKDQTIPTWLTDAEMKQIQKIAGANRPRSIRNSSPYTDGQGCYYLNTIWAAPTDDDPDPFPMLDATNPY